MEVTTKGDVIVTDIKIGDIQYEFGYGCCIKSEVITLPVRDDNGYWTWTNKQLVTGKEINYGVTESASHYGPNLYTHEAYSGCKMVT